MRQIPTAEEVYQALQAHSVHSVPAVPANLSVQVVLAAEPAEAHQALPAQVLVHHLRLHHPVQVLDAAAVLAVHRLHPAPAAEALADRQDADINICQ